MSLADGETRSKLRVFRAIREGLAQLAEAIRLGDADVVYLRLGDLDGALRDLAANARDSHASIALPRRDHDVAPERFAAYKHLIIAYLEAFLGRLSPQREHVERAVRSIDNFGIDEMESLAEKGDDSLGISDCSDGEKRWRNRWSGLASWLVSRQGSRRGLTKLKLLLPGRSAICSACYVESLRTAAGP